MRYADFAAVEKLVREMVNATSVGRFVTSVSVDKTQDEDGDDYLRVILRLNELKKLSYEDLAPVIENIERAVGEIDERVASVRLSEAA